MHLWLVSIPDVIRKKQKLFLVHKAGYMYEVVPVPLPKLIYTFTVAAQLP